MTTARQLLLAITAILLLAGCARQGGEAKVRYFWPPSDVDAKVEYLGFYASEANLKEALFTNLAEVVFGVELARPLFQRPFAVDAHQHLVLVSDAGSRKVFLLDLKRKTFTSTAIAEGSGKAFGFPAGVAILDSDEYLVSDSLAKRIGRYSFDGLLLSVFGENQLDRPTALAIDRRHQRIAVVDTGAHKLALFNFDGDLLGYLGERGDGPGQFSFPVDADFDQDGNLFVLDSMNFRVQRFDWNGGAYAYSRHFGEIGTQLGSFMRPKGVAVSPSGHVYVTDGLGHKVVVFDREGNFLLTFGSKFVASEGKFAPGGLYVPAGIATDEQDGIWVVDSYNRMIHHFQYLNDDYLRAHPIRSGEAAQMPAAPE